jgi:Domain of unknown function (DUF4386)
MPDARYYKTCAVFAVVGSIVALAANVIHPDLPIGVREAHALIASRGDWRITHGAIIVAALLLSYGVAGLASACERAGSGVARLALLSTIVGASVVAVSIGIDGFAEKTLSDAWAGAPAAQKAQLLIAATPLQLIHVGLFYVWAGMWWGVAFVLYGWAMLESRTFPAWYAWTAVLGGIGVCIVTVAQYLSPHDSVEIALRLLLFVEILWTFALGWFLWGLKSTNQVPID